MLYNAFEIGTVGLYKHFVTINRPDVVVDIDADPIQLSDKMHLKSKKKSHLSKKKYLLPKNLSGSLPLSITTICKLSVHKCPVRLTFQKLC